MGFCSSLLLYRPTPPPVITGRALATFMQRFLDIELTDTTRSRSTLNLKFGNAIDQDAEPSWWIAPTASEYIGTIVDIDWDIEQHALPIMESLEIISQFDTPIYRGYIGLGAAVDEKVNSLRRQRSPENNEDFMPDSWAIEIGPVESGRDGEFVVGWIALGLSGNGYLFPWTLRELVNRAEGVQEIEQLMRLCRDVWPVEPEAVGLDVQSKREQMGPYWPYDELDRHWDWYWGLQGIL